jgi:hypothetical protein
MPSGVVLLIGGVNSNGDPTATVESYAWDPSVTATLDPGFYVAAATQNRTAPNADDGIWGLELGTADPILGGLNVGGLLPAAGKDVGFTAFTISQTQNVNVNIDLSSLPGSSGPLEMTLKVWDRGERLIAGPITGVGHLQWNQSLPPGFYVLEFHTSERAPPAIFHLSLDVPRIDGGISVGGVLQAADGVPGYLAFTLHQRQEVTLHINNQSTYGPGGVGETILSLYDSLGRKLAAVGPGAGGG